MISSGSQNDGTNTDKFSQNKLWHQHESNSDVMKYQLKRRFF